MRIEATYELGQWPTGFRYVCESCLIKRGELVGCNDIYKREYSKMWPVGSLFSKQIPLCNKCAIGRVIIN